MYSKQSAHDLFVPGPAADRATTDSIADAKEGLVVSCVDTIETYRTHVRIEQIY